jgi:hypothetical protein
MIRMLKYNKTRTKRHLNVRDLQGLGAAVSFAPLRHTRGYKNVLGKI